MTQIRQLELELYGDDVMLDWLFKKQNEETPENISRREFLRRGGQVGAALVGMQVANSGIAQAAEFLNQKGLGNSATEFMQENLGIKEAQAATYEQNIKRGFPPGIADAAARKHVYAIAWKALQNKDHNKVYQLLNPQSSHWIGSKELITEPAFYFLGKHVNGLGESYDATKIKQQNPSMFYFGRFIDGYIRQYSPYLDPRKTRNIVRPIDEDAIISLFFASGMQLNDFTKFGYDINASGDYFTKITSVANQFLKKQNNEKEMLLKEMMKKMKKQDKVQQRIAAWIGFFLEIYYEVKIKNKKDADLIYDNIEMPLRNINPQFKIRGPPHYEF